MKHIETLFFMPLIALITGIILFWQPTEIVVFSLLLIVFICCCVKKIYFLLAPFFVSVGLAVSYCQYHYYEHRRSLYTKKPLAIKGEVVDVQSAPGSLFEGIMQIKTYEVREKEQANYQSSSFSFLCYQREPFACQVGDYVFLEEIILPSTGIASSLQQVSYGDYLTKEGLAAAVFLQKNDKIFVIGRAHYSVQRWLWSHKMRVLHAIKKQVSTLAYAYFALIFLGYKHIPDNHEIRKIFNVWGLAHFLARAGLHIMLFIWIWQFFMSLLPMPITLKRVLLFFICFLYALFSWVSIPFFRAYLVFVLARIAYFCDRPFNFLHTLTVSCLFVLLLNPIQLFFLDFQLTFGLTFVLGWFAQHNARLYQQGKSNFS